MQTVGNVVGEEWRGTEEGGTLSVGVECAVSRKDGLGVSCEQRSNAQPDLGVRETAPATKNTFTRVRRGDMGHQACSGE